MIYLVDPASFNRPPCFAYCKTLCEFKGCATFCGIKPLYGIDPTDI